MFKLRNLFWIATLCGNVAMAEDGTILSIQMSRRLLNIGMEPLPEQSRNFCEWQSGYLSCGTQWIKGKLDVVLSPSNDRAMIGVNYHAQVTAAVQTYVDGYVNDRYIFFNTNTVGNTTKWSSWTPRGLENIYAATTNAGTSVYNIGTNGILFSGIALRQFESRIGEVQQTANNQLASQANATIDKVAGSQMEQQRSDFKDHAYKTYFADGKFPGRTAAQTTNDYVFFQSIAERPANALPSLTYTSPDVAFRVSDTFSNAWAKNLLNDRTLLLKDLKPILVNLGLAPYIEHHRRPPPTPAINISFLHDNPLSMQFGNGSIHIEMNIATFHDKPLTAHLTSDYQLKNQKDEIIGVRTGGVSGMPTEAPKEFIDAINELLPSTITTDGIGKDFMPTLFGKYLSVSEYRAENGWLVLGWKI